MRHKEILIETKQMFSMIKKILFNIKNGMEFRKAYLVLFPEFESSNEEMILNRFKIKYNLSSNCL